MAGRYIARFEPEQEKGEEDLLPFPDDDAGEDDEGGMFAASVACRMPQFQVPADIMAQLRDGEALQLEFMVQVAISGDDFIPGKLVSAFGACCTSGVAWRGVVRCGVLWPLLQGCLKWRA